jgi:transposase
VNEIIRIGVDTSKSVFVLHGVDAAEQAVLRRKLRRHQVLEFFRQLEATRIGMEACGAAHHWARELQALGHDVVLLPPQYVKPYVKRNKNDAADAEAICEAMSRPTMRFVPVKTPEQQAALMLAGTRDGLIRRRTRLTNTIRGYAAEFGLTTARGLDKIRAAAGSHCGEPGPAEAGARPVRRLRPRIRAALAANHEDRSEIDGLA